MRFRGNVIRLLGLRNRTLSFSLILIGKKTIEAQDRLLKTILGFLLFHMLGNIPIIRAVRKCQIVISRINFFPQLNQSSLSVCGKLKNLTEKCCSLKISNRRNQFQGVCSTNEQACIWDSCCCSRKLSPMKGRFSKWVQSVKMGVLNFVHLYFFHLTVGPLVTGKALPACECIRTQLTRYLFGHLQFSRPLSPGDLLSLWKPHLDKFDQI